MRILIPLLHPNTRCDGFGVGRHGVVGGRAVLPLTSLQRYPLFLFCCGPWGEHVHGCVNHWRTTTHPTNRLLHLPWVGNSSLAFQGLNAPARYTTKRTPRGSVIWTDR